MAIEVAPLTECSLAELAMNEFLRFLVEIAVVRDPGRRRSVLHLGRRSDDVDVGCIGFHVNEIIRLRKNHWVEQREHMERGLPA